jgi:hypothetical protein
MKLLICSIFLPLLGFTQLPETDVWLFKIDKKEGKHSFSNPLNITNRVGYDNQPVFTNDDKAIFYVSIDSTNQADIYKYDIKSKKRVNLTNSKVSEYSSTILPNGLGFSCVVVETDSAQRIWQYTLDGKFDKITHQKTDSVGYYTWLNKDSLLYYKLTEPHSLRCLDLTNDKDVWICDMPTRAFKKTGVSNQFIYGIKNKESIQYRIYNSSLKESREYAVHHSLSEDFIWNNELGLIKSDNSDLLHYNEQSKQWETLFSFDSLGIKKITRFVFDSKSKQLAIVSNQ